MTKLAINSRVAERLRGCTFAENFFNSEDVVLNRGTVFGSPTINKGLTANASGDYVTYPTLREVRSVSFFITLDSTTEDIMTLSATHSIEVSGGTITATGFTSPTIRVDGVATSTITTARSHVTVTTATGFTADTIEVGRANVTEELKMWNVELTLDESLDYANNTTFTYASTALLNLPTDAARNDVATSMAMDVSSFNNDANLANAPTKNPEIGYHFNNTSNYMTVPSATLQPQNITLSLWIQRDEVTGSFEIMLDSAYVLTASNNDGYGFFIRNNYDLSFEYGNGTSKVTVSAPLAESDWVVGKWYYLVVTYDGTNTIMYRNLEIIHTDSSGISNIAPPSTVLNIGRRAGSSFVYFGGTMATIQIYPKALTEIQVWDNYFKGLNRINVV